MTPIQLDGAFRLGMIARVKPSRTRAAVLKAFNSGNSLGSKGTMTHAPCF